uniref:Uncharacterized protein n=1 Tax=Alexandrium andersonii TaxID=327968 RepID=A0A7S2FH84_9DINO
MAAAAQPVLRPLVLSDGERPVECFQLFAGATSARRYLLEGYERVSWECRVLDDYDVIFSSRFCCSGLQSDTERSREITERERAGEFSGYLDLSKEHVEWMGDVGSGTAVLSLEFDNTYSFFTSKRVELRLTKLCGAPPKLRCYNAAIVACEGAKQWERALQLLTRMRDVRVAPDVSSYNTAMSVCRSARRWQDALGLLDGMLQDRLAPDAASYNTAIGACEDEGLVGHALRLMDDMPNADEAGPRPEEHEDLEWLRRMLAEAVERCPSAAQRLRSQLVVAQGSLDAYVSGASRQGH